MAAAIDGRMRRWKDGARSLGREMALLAAGRALGEGHRLPLVRAAWRARARDGKNNNWVSLLQSVAKGVGFVL
jgi:hypothetical protein